jgi:short-subunit dehydrogenase
VARRPEKLARAEKELRDRHGVDVVTFSADLAEPEAPRQIEAFTRVRGLEIDWLVNNAGSGGPDLLEDRDWDAHVSFYELMMISMAQMCHRFVPPMRERGFGRVVNVASFAGRIARPAGCNYGPAKAWVVALSEELALTLKGSGVHVSALCPGFTHTDFHESAGLMDMKNALPKAIWYDADVVVREGIRAVERGKAIHVSGRLYRWLDPLAQSVFTRWLLKAGAPGRQID